MQKLPPVEKIPEALSAIADNRVEIDEQSHEAKVRSSDGSKTYTVSWNPEDNTFTSNDNATYWQLYPGYPILAVMILRGLINYDLSAVKDWKDINWNKLNNDFKRNYSKAVQQIMETRGLDPEFYSGQFKAVMDQIKDMPITIKRSSLRPPK